MLAECAHHSLPLAPPYHKRRMNHARSEPMQDPLIPRGLVCVLNRSSQSAYRRERRFSSATPPRPSSIAVVGSGTNALNLYTIPPVPFDGVFVTSAYSSPAASWPKPWTVRPFGSTPAANC